MRRAFLRTPLTIAGPHLLFAVILLLGVTLVRNGGASPFLSSMVSSIAITAVALMGLGILYGWSGQISIGHAAFVGLGAYTTALVHEHSQALQVSWLYDLVAVVLVSFVAGLIVGLPALRITGFQLVVVTLGLAESFMWVMNTYSDLSGGSQGRFVGFIEIAGLSFGSPDERLILTVAAASLVAIGVAWLKRSSMAHAMFAVRDSPLAASSIGVDPRSPRLWAFIVSAVLAGVAGWLFAYSNVVVVPGSYSLFQSVYLLAAVIVGGRNSIAGAWVGATFLIVVPEISRSVLDGRLYPLFIGGSLVLIALVIPRGIAPTVLLQLERARTKVSHKKRIKRPVNA